MANKVQLGGGVIGLMFLALGIFKFVQGNDWVVWIILGVLFGGIGAAGKLIKGGRA